jgi:hypothetical protein
LRKKNIIGGNKKNRVKTLSLPYTASKYENEKTFLYLHQNIFILSGQPNFPTLFSLFDRAVSISKYLRLLLYFFFLKSHENRVLIAFSEKNTADSSDVAILQETVPY